MLDTGSCDSTKLGEPDTCLKLLRDLIVKIFRSGFFYTT